MILSTISLAFFHPDYKVFQTYKPIAGEKLISFDEISLPVVSDMTAGKMAILVDAREPYLYNEAHIPGAVNLPISKFGSSIQAFKKKIPENQTLITYCSDLNCSDSRILANRLYKSGYKFILIYRDGIQGYIDAQKLTESNEN
jgi:rhodanese-related sulfurtransferase